MFDFNRFRVVLFCLFAATVHGLAAANQRWNPFRFVQQSSKFVSLPGLLSKPPSSSTSVQPSDVLWEPGSGNTFEFAPLDDVVMGGVSSSNFDQTTGIWRGSVTDANNGGFIGIRSTPNLNYDMSNCKGLEIKVKAPAKRRSSRFKFGTRDTTEFNGVLWATSLDINPNGGTTTWRVPLDRQIPTRFANKVPGKVFDKTNVTGFQVTYSKFEYEGELNPLFEVGDVELQVLEIRAF